MAKKNRAGSTPAVRALLAARIAFTEHPYEHDEGAPSFGLEAAQALGRDPRQVFKTLLVASAGDLAVGIVPVATTLDLKAMAAALGVKKVAMAPVADAERVTGYVAGGISPLGQRRSLPTVLDTSAANWSTILVSGGRRGLDIELSPDDLARLTGASRADIAAS